MLILGVVLSQDSIGRSIGPCTQTILRRFYVPCLQTGDVEDQVGQLAAPRDGEEEGPGDDGRVPVAAEELDGGQDHPGDPQVRDGRLQHPDRRVVPLLPGADSIVVVVPDEVVALVPLDAQPGRLVVVDKGESRDTEKDRLALLPGILVDVGHPEGSYRIVPEDAQHGRDRLVKPINGVVGVGRRVRCGS